MALLLWLKTLLLGKWEASFYRENRAELCTTNLKLLRTACLFSTCMCLFLFCLTFFSPLIFALKLFYLRFTLFFLLLSALVLTVGARHRVLVAPLFYLFAAGIFTLAIDVGTRRSADLPAVTFCVFLIIIPILFVTRPIYAVLLSAAACGAFCLVTARVKGADSFLARYDILNAACCCLVGFGLDITIMNLHLENLQGKSHFRRQSATDGLTLLPNRRRFDGYADRLFRTHLRPGTRIYLFMLDIDDFKRYNDSYGHVQGDDCLRRVAQALERTAQVHNAFLARFGGEEFVAAAVLHSGVEADKLAWRMVDCVSGLGLVHRQSPTGTVTLSAGWAVRRDEGEDYMESLARADSALYAAKRGGKNCALHWTPDMARQP